MRFAYCALHELCAMPDSLKKPLGERLIEAAASGSKTLAAEAIKLALAAGSRCLLP